MIIPEEWLDSTLVAAIAPGLVRWSGPVIRQRLSRRRELVHSFGGGVAVAYVFMSLFPEIELAHEWLGDTVHVVTLVSFLIFLALETRLLTTRPHAGAQAAAPVSGGDHAALAHDAPSDAVFWWHLALLAISTWMVIFAAPERSGDELMVALFGVTTVGIDLAYKDQVHRRFYDESYAQNGRLLLTIAPIAGWVAHEVIQPSEIVFDLFIAVLAGILLQGICRDEMPANDSARLQLIPTGAAIYTALSLLTAHS